MEGWPGLSQKAEVALITFVFLPHCLGQLRLRPKGQKTVTRFALSDAATPNSLKSSPLRRVTTHDGAVWRAEERGLARQHQGRIEYLQGLRYLPDDKVESIETLESKSGSGRSGIWVRTSTGVSRIEVMPMTLATKAAHFERRIAERQPSASSARSTSARARQAGLRSITDGACARGRVSVAGTGLGDRHPHPGTAGCGNSRTS